MMEEIKLFKTKEKISGILETVLADEFNISVLDIINDDLYISTDVFLRAFIDRCAEGKVGVVDCEHCNHE